MAEEGKKVFTVNPNGKKVKIIVGVCVALLLIVAISIASITIVPAGHKGVTLNMGAVTGAVMNEGINFKIPFVQNAEIIDVRVTYIFQRCHFFLQILYYGYDVCG